LHTKRIRLDLRSETGHALIKAVLFLFGLSMLAVAAFAMGFVTAENKSYPYRLIRGDSDERSIAERRAPQNALWAERVVAGGYILHFRHAQREKWNDVTAFDAYELKKGIDASKASFHRATCLTAQGEEEAKLIGAVFEMTGSKIAQVIASPSCRARQTAMLAFGRIDTIENSLLHRTAIVPAQREASAERLRKVMEVLQPLKGQNIALVGHSNTLSYDDARLIDIDNTDGIDMREETGFVVIENKHGQLIAQHRFKNISEFANAIVTLPVDRSSPDR
jgi:phosphohistidine phosphatase SixA